MNPFTKKEKALARKMFNELLPCAIELFPDRILNKRFNEIDERFKAEWMLAARWHLNELKKLSRPQ
jgi:hypothetical protein